jgi:dTDP-4-amino-4,6-dideoxygalactose transaminase
VDDDYNLDPDLLERAVSPRTKAILPVHLTGLPCRIEEILAVARAHSLKVIADAAQCVGATYRGRPVGSWGDLACFSFHPLKNLHVWGDGGIIAVQEEQLAERLRLERNHGLVTRDESHFFSYNSRLDSIQALVALKSLPHLERVTARRRKNASLYFERLQELEPRLRLPARGDASCEPAFHVFQIWTERRDELKAYLAEKRIETKIHYPVPVHLQPAGSQLGYRLGDLPVTERLARGILSLPVRENLSESEVDRVCDEIAAFFC